MTLPLETKKELLEIKDIKNKQPYLKWEDPINNAFMHQNLSTHWQTFSQYINQDVIDCLIMASDMAKFKNPEIILEQSKVDKLKQDFKDIEKGEISSKNGDYPSAIEKYKELEILKHSDEVQYKIANLYYLNGDYSLVIDICSK
jgi:hypothetical protein